MVVKAVITVNTVSRKISQMKQSELMASVNAGGLFLVATFVSGRVESITIRDKKTGQARGANIIKEIVMTDTEPCIVSRWMKDDQKAEDYKVPCAKGQKIVVRVKPQGMNVPEVNGTCEILT